MTLAASVKGETDWESFQVPVIRYKGQFDWQGLYRLVRTWIEENRYKFQEKKYKHKGDEVEVDMTGQRKLDEMYRRNVHVHFHIWHLREIEVVEGTKTVKRNTGHVHIEILGGVEIDWQGRFKGSKMTEKLFKWWKVIKKREFTATQLEPMSIELYRLQTDIKSFLNMQTDANYYG